MKTKRPIHSIPRGVSLIETMVAIGVLAVVGPLSVGAVLKSGAGGASARAETRATVIVDHCLTEIRSARDAISLHLPTLKPGEAFGHGAPLCLAFDGNARLLGAVNSASYSEGADSVGGEIPVYLARIAGSLDAPRDGHTPLLTITLSVEYPAVAPEAKRRTLDFHTKLP